MNGQKNMKLIPGAQNPPAKDINKSGTTPRTTPQAAKRLRTGAAKAPKKV